jgi:hypothetical protein
MARLWHASWGDSEVQPVGVARQLRCRRGLSFGDSVLHLLVICAQQHSVAVTGVTSNNRPR